jgi:zinc/manganese transport system permease protein
MFAQDYIRHAFLAGSFTALGCGLVGYFVVLRAQVFAGDALSHVAFTGALAAAAAGLDTRIGLFAGTVVVALAIGGLGRRAPVEDVTIGIAFAWILLGARALFGSIYGLSAGDARLAALIGAGVLGVTLAVARPLLFASVDPAVAAARGVPVRALGLVFLCLLGVVAAEATEAVGALLLLGLIAAPAGAAHRLASNPYVALGLSAALALAAMWLGLTLSYLVASVPPSAAVIAVATALYGIAHLLTADVARLRRRDGGATWSASGAPGTSAGRGT